MSCWVVGRGGGVGGGGAGGGLSVPLFLQAAIDNIINTGRMIFFMFGVFEGVTIYRHSERKVIRSLMIYLKKFSRSILGGGDDLLFPRTMHKKPSQKMQNIKTRVYHHINILALGLLVLTTLFSCKKEKDDEPQTCAGVGVAGKLNYASATETYTYRTSGGGTITIKPKQILIGYDSYPGFKIELWRDTMVNGQARNLGVHESLNGKHIKDRFGSRRTLLFPDGTKLTIVSDGRFGLITSISIYEANEAHRIAGVCHAVDLNKSTGAEVQRLDKEEPDGETGGFELTTDGLLFVNYYQEDSPDVKIMNRVPLGQIYRAEPSRVTDLFDDPTRSDT